jgi:putative hemolysin
MDITELIIVALMLVLNSLFAAYELALASVGIGRLNTLASEQKPGAKAALAMKNRMEASLAVVQIGITLCGAIAAATSGAGAEEYIAPRLAAYFHWSDPVAEFVAIALVVLPLAAITIILGELVPKTFALRNPEFVCLKLSPLMRIFALMVYPAVLFFEAITKVTTTFLTRGVGNASSDAETGLGELRAQAHLLRTARILGAHEERMIVGASRITRTKLRDIMVPASDIVMLDVSGKLTDHIITAHLEAHTRFPVTARAADPHAIMGYVNVKELIFLPKSHPENPDLREIIRPVTALPPDMTVSQAFAGMMADHTHLALVRDAAHHVLGLITLEDILEEVVGEIQDEFDRLPRHITPMGKQWVVAGGATIGKIRTTLAQPLFIQEAPPETILADWITAHHGPAIKGGDVITIDTVKLLVRKVRRHKLLEAIVDAPPAQAPSSTLKQV